MCLSQIHVLVCVSHCYMFYEFFCNFLFSLPVIILYGIRAGGSFPSVAVVPGPRLGQRRSYKESPSEFLGKAFQTVSGNGCGMFLEAVSTWLLGEFPVLGNECTSSAVLARGSRECLLVPPLSTWGPQPIHSHPVWSQVP